MFSCQSDDKIEDPKTAVQLAKYLQDLRGADGDVVKERELMEENVGRRKTVRYIHNSHYIHRKKQATFSLDIAFKRRLSRLRETDGKDMIHCVTLLHELTKFLSTALWQNTGTQPHTHPHTLTPTHPHTHHTHPHTHTHTHPHTHPNTHTQTQSTKSNNKRSVH